MFFGHDTEHALACAVDLVNSGPSRSSTSVVGSSHEELSGVPALAAFVRRHDVSDVESLHDRDVVSVRALRAVVRAAFGAPDAETAAAAVNLLMATAEVSPRLTDHDGYAWHLHYFTPGASVAEHLRADCGMALAQVVAAGEWQRLRRCAAPGCERVLVDLSRNRSKRYCDARTCGNRLHVAAYRERRRATTP